jgi:BirA family transcriptional regulator, biotin operon repressor / biotin---[acetyl-CoA-carboxylase] ligase
MTASAAAPSIVRLGRVDSTQAIAFALAADGAADRTVVLADSQAVGRGRRGRAWLDEPGASLLASIVLRPRLDPARLATLSLTAAVAVAEALAAVAGLAPRLKWPNDVLVDGYKIAGILLESRLQPAPLVVLGVGVNVSQATFPPDLAARATSIRLASGRDVSRDAVLAALLQALDRWRARLEGEGFAPVRARWRALADTLGRSVSVDGVHGVAIDVDDDGALILADGEQRHRVVAGETVEGGR